MLDGTSKLKENLRRNRKVGVIIGVISGNGTIEHDALYCLGSRWKGFKIVVYSVK
jgi:hypothetical protein